MAQNPYSHKVNQKIVKEIKKDLKCKSTLTVSNLHSMNYYVEHSKTNYNLTITIWPKDFKKFMQNLELNELVINKIIDHHYPKQINGCRLLLKNSSSNNNSTIEVYYGVNQELFRNAYLPTASDSTNVARKIIIPIIEKAILNRLNQIEKEQAHLKSGEAVQFDSTLHLIPLAKAYVNRDTAKIRTLVNNGYQQYPNEEIYFRLYVRELMSKGNLTLAESLLQKGRGIYENETELNNSYGYLFLLKKEYDKALKMAEKILDIGPFNETADLIRVISEQQLEKKK